MVLICVGLVHPAPAQAGTSGIVPLAQITPAERGRTVTVQGTVVGVANFSSGFRFYLNDSTAQVVVLVWDDDWDHVRDNYHLNVGAVMSVTGVVDVYYGQIEVIPERGKDVHVVKWAQHDWRKYDLGALSGNDHNSIAWVEGRIADIQPFALGATLLVVDATGAQVVTLYDVVARRIPQQEKLRIGQHVSIVGRVRARRRIGIDIVPALPQDVYVPAQDQ
jgi:RecJ-like exonuclease